MFSIAGAAPYTASLSVFVQLKESKNFRRQKSLPPTTSLKKNSELQQGMQYVAKLGKAAQKRCVHVREQ